MKIEVNEKREIVLKEVYSGILMETSEGNQIGICMRDDTFEINVIPKDGKSRWNRVNMQTRKIEVTGEKSSISHSEEGCNCGICKDPRFKQ